VGSIVANTSHTRPSWRLPIPLS